MRGTEVSQPARRLPADRASLRTPHRDAVHPPLRSAIDNNRRIRPATASSSSEDRRRPSSSSDARRADTHRRPSQVLGHRIAEDLPRHAPPGRPRHRGPRRAAQNGVVEIGERLAVARTHDAAAAPPRPAGVLGLGHQQCRSTPSPSRTTTRSAPRTTSLATCRRAAPTSSAPRAPATGPPTEGASAQSATRAPKCPRHAASASSMLPPTTTWAGRPRTGRPRMSSSPVWRANAFRRRYESAARSGCSPESRWPTTHAPPPCSRRARILTQPPCDTAPGPARPDHHVRAAHDVQPAGESQQRGDLRALADFTTSRLVPSLTSVVIATLPLGRPPSIGISCAAATGGSLTPTSRAHIPVEDRRRSARVM